MTISKLNELRSQLALLIMKYDKLAVVCKELRKHNLIYSNTQLSQYLEEHPITRFEREMAKNLEACCGGFENLWKTYNNHKIRN